MMTTAPPNNDDDVEEIDDDEDAPEVSDLAALLGHAPEPGVDYGVGSHLDEHGQPKIIERHLIVPPELAGLRLDHFVKTQIQRLSRTKIQAIIETQLRRADGGTAKPSTTVALGDHFIIRRQAKAEPPCPRTFTVLYEDARMRIVDKPAMLPVHATAKFYFNTLTRVLWERYPDEDELQLCHRLDRETSGCVVLARDKEAAAKLKGAIAQKDKTTKQYLAVVHGAPPWQTEATIDLPLRLAQPSDPTKLTHVRMLPATMAEAGAQSATTRVVVERTGPLYSLVRCTLVTGRQHQIRAHLAAQGFPIVGDKIYTHGDDAFIEYCAKGLTPELAQLFVLPRHALHAARITVPHPVEKRDVTAEAPLPADMASLIGE